MRENTERPITAMMRTSALVGRSIPRQRTEVQRIVWGETNKVPFRRCGMEKLRNESQPFLPGRNLGFLATSSNH